MVSHQTLSFRLIIMITALISFSVCHAQKPAAEKIPVDPEVKMGKLPNGLTYYIRKNLKPEKKIQLRLVVNAGSVLEDADQQGLAHFMEHMNFNGSEHFPKNELVSYLQSIGVQFGADLNANTGFDETVYILPVPAEDPEKVDKAFTILEDWAGNALLDTTEINKERGVVLEESRLGKGAGERMGKKYFPKLFNGSLYAKRLPIGKDSILEHFKAASLKRFYKTWYRPDLMAVIVVGDIDPAAAEKEIVKHFSHFKNPTPEKPRPSVIPIAPRTKSEGMVLTDKEQTYNVLQIFNYVEPSSPVRTWSDYRKSIVEQLFSTIVNQRLSELTQQANPPFVFAGTGLGEFIRGYRAFVSFALLGDKPVKAAVDALTETTESVKKYGLLQSELSRAKSSLLNESERALKDKDKTESARLVEEYREHYLAGSPIPGIANSDAYLHKVIDGITLAEVNALSAKMETKQGKFALITAPEKDASKLPGNQQLLAILEDAHKIPVKKYEEKAVAKTLLDQMPAAGKITNEATDATLGTTNLTLSNGITVTLRPTDFKNDEIQMDSWRWGGYSNFPLADKPSAENCTNVVQSMGIKDLSPVDLEKFMAGKTVNVTPYINQYDEGIQGASSVKDFETMLQLIHLYFTSPRTDDGLFQAFIKQQKAFLQNIKANPMNFFQDSVSKIEYGNNPWNSGIPDAKDMDRINKDLALKIYKGIFGNAYGLHFTFVGNLDPATVKPLLETYLGSLPSAQKENKFTDVGLRPVKGVVEKTIVKGAEKRSQVSIIFSGDAAFSPEEALNLKALTDVLNIKIIEQLREEMSGIYGGGMRASMAKRPNGHYAINVGFPCGPENVDKLTKALFDIIKTAQDKGIEQKDLDKVKETLQKQNEDNMKNNDHWLENLSTAWIEQYDPAWIQNYSKQINALTVQGLQMTAKKYFNWENYIKVVLQPEK